MDRSWTGCWKGVGAAALRAGFWTKLDRLLPLLALFQAASGDGQWDEAGQVVGKGLELLPCVLVPGRS